MSEVQPVHMPDITRNAEGKERRLGVELEMSDITVDRLAKLVSEFLHDQGMAVDVRESGRYDWEIVGDPAGDWQVELDFGLLKSMGRQAIEPGMMGELVQSLEELMASVAETVVPVELVSPPLPMARLQQVETLISRIRKHGAKGTSDRWSNAFGMHLNMEVPETTADYIDSILKAFFCLFDWLQVRCQVDMARRVTPYIDPFPVDYVRLVLAPDYQPDLEQLMRDYLEFNPTRNRALDMLPVFAHVDEKLVREYTDDPRIKSRPALHYRLPNCDIHDSNWSLSLAWNDWLAVERLAADRQLLNLCCHDYLAYLNSPSERLFGQWLKTLQGQYVPMLTGSSG